jgi:hypothetical protein
VYLIVNMPVNSAILDASAPGLRRARSAPAARRAPFVLSAACALGVLVAPAAAQWTESAGGAGLGSIAMTPSARPSGLAGAYTALGSGHSALGINPAGLAREPGMAYSGSVQSGLTRLGNVAASVPLAGGALAFSAVYLDHGDITLTDENAGSLGSTRPYNLYPALTYARPLGAQWRWGATLKAGRESLGDFEGSRTAWGAGFDAGVQYQPERRNYGLGLAATNVGRQLTGYYDGDATRRALPAALRAGAYFQPRSQRKLTLTADFETPYHTPFALAAGGEYRVIPEWTLRAGTRWNRDDLRNLRGWLDPNSGIEEEGGEASKIAAGTTLRVGKVAVDYAAQWWRDLGFVHYLTVGWSAGI